MFTPPPFATPCIASPDATRPGFFLLPLTLLLVLSCKGDVKTGPDFGPAAIVATTPARQVLEVGGVVPVAPAVRVVNEAGDPVPSVEVVFALTSGGGTISGTTAVTGIDGIAALAIWTVGTSAGDNSVTATASDLPGHAVVFSATATAGPPVSVSLLTSPPAAVASGVRFSAQPVLQLKDTFGNAAAMSGVAVVATLTPAAGAALEGTTTVMTDANGAARFTDLDVKGAIGDYTLHLIPAGLPEIPVLLHLDPGLATRLILTSPPSITTVSGAALAMQPVISLTDASGNSVSQAGVAIAAAITSGGGSLVGSSSVLTNAQGDAAFTNLGIAGPSGPHTLAFTSSGVTAAISPIIQVGAGQPTNLGLNAGNGQTAPGGTPVLISPSVAVTDGSGNPVSGVSVNFVISAGGGTVAVPHAVSDAQGLASAGPWTLGSTPGANTLTAVASGLIGSPVSFSATATLPVGSRLVLTTQPSSGRIGVVLAPAFLVQLEDANGGSILQPGVVVTVGLTGGGGILSGTMSVPTDPTGSASFPDLAISGSVGSRNLTFTASGFLAVNSAGIPLAAGLAANIEIAGGNNQTAPAGTSLPVNPLVLATDFSGNPVSGVAVQFQIASGGGNIANASSTTNAQGQASGGAWVLGPAAGFNTLTALATGLSGSPLSFTATGTIVTGPPSSMLQVSGDGQTAVAGSAVAESLVVRVLDANGKGVGAVTVSWAIIGGQGTVSSPASTTDATGLAAVEWTLGSIAGPNTVKASLGGLSSIFNATGVAGPASRLLLVTQPLTGISGEILSPQPAVQLADANGNAVGQSGTNVTAALSSGGGNLGGNNLVSTDGSGLATFADLFIVGSAGPRTLKFTAPPLAAVTSGPITLALQTVVSVQISPSTLNLLVGEAQSMNAVALDGGGQPIAGAVFTWASTNPGVITVSVAGVARGISAGNARIRVTSGGISDSASASVIPVPVASVVISPPGATIPSGTTQVFQAVAFDSIGGVLPGRVFAWSSSAPAVATVDNAGLVTGVSAGTTKVVAATGGKSDTVSVTVTAVLPGLQPVFSTYFGGSLQDQVRDVTTDPQGNVYIAGGTASPDFPVTPGALDVTFNGTYDGYIAKLSPTGAVLWATFLGGPNYDRIYGIEVDAAGFIYVAGRAGDRFPVTPGAFQTTFAGSPDDPPYGPQDGFVCKLAPNATAVVFCSYFGTSDAKIVRDIAVDPQGNMYLGSSSESGSFPAAWFANAAQPGNSGGLDGVVAKISADGSQVLWATYIGGSQDEAEEASIRVNAAGQAYVLYSSASPDAPTPNGFDHSLDGPRDAYLVKLASNGSRLLFGTYLGGSGGEHVETHELMLDNQGNAIVATGTSSTDFPTTPGAFQPNFGGAGGPGTGQGTNYGGDIFVAKISADGSQLMAATYVGGSEGEGSEGVGVDGAGNIYVSGVTYSPGLPFLSGGYQPQLGGDADMIILKLTPDLTTLIYGTYLGGVDQDFSRSSFATQSGDFIVVGNVLSTDWPTLNPAQSINRGDLEGVIARFH
ncbi:MAG: SBBP repeat-containing protein [Gemmatimonadota bacterium]